MVHIVDKHNPIVHNDTRQHNKSDQRYNADLTAADKQSQQSPGESQRNGEHNDKGQKQRLELGHHNQVHEHHRQQEHQQHLADGIVDHLVLPGKYQAIALGYRIVRQPGLHPGGHLAHIVTLGYGCRHLNIAILVRPTDGT